TFDDDFVCGHLCPNVFAALGAGTDIMNIVHGITLSKVPAGIRLCSRHNGSNACFHSGLVDDMHFKLNSAEIVKWPLPLSSGKPAFVEPLEIVPKPSNKPCLVFNQVRTNRFCCASSLHIPWSWLSTVFDSP